MLQKHAQTTCTILSLFLISCLGQGVALGDVNGDALLDAVFANAFGAANENRVCEGNGDGTFACSDVSGDTNDTYGVALGDVNGDTILDAVFANYGDENRVCEGNGDGTFCPLR